MTVIDNRLEPDLDRVAHIALNTAMRIREENPRELFDDLVDLVLRHPMKAAQLLAALAAFVNPDEDTGSLARRVEQISAGKRFGRTA